MKKMKGQKSSPALEIYVEPQSPRYPPGYIPGPNEIVPMDTSIPPPPPPKLNGP